MRQAQEIFRLIKNSALKIVGLHASPPEEPQVWQRTNPPHPAENHMWECYQYDLGKEIDGIWHLPRCGPPS
jgi:hypothetical protein